MMYKNNQQSKTLMPFKNYVISNTEENICRDDKKSIVMNCERRFDVSKLKMTLSTKYQENSKIEWGKEKSRDTKTHHTYEFKEIVILDINLISFHFVQRRDSHSLKLQT